MQLFKLFRKSVRKPDDLLIAFYGNLASFLQPFVFDVFRTQKVGCELAPDPAGANLHIVCAWPDDTLNPDDLERLSAQIRAGKGSTIAVIEAPDPLSEDDADTLLDDWNSELKSMADDLGAHFVPVRSKFLRWGSAECLESDYKPSPRGAKAIAAAITKLVLREQASASISDSDITLSCARTGRSLRTLLDTDPAAADDLLESMCSPLAAAKPDALWSTAETDAPPPSDVPLDTHSQDLLTALNNGKIAMPERYGWPQIEFGPEGKIDWAQTGPDRSWQSMFLGLDFLVGPLGVIWRLLSSDDARKSDAFAKYGMPALSSALEVLLSFQVDNPPDSPAVPRAWHEGTVSRRQRALLSLLSCCLAARNKAVSLPAGTFARVGMEMARTAEMLSSEQTYIDAGNHGVRQDYCLYVFSSVLNGCTEASSWRDTALKRLQERQLDKALSKDGVWLEHSPGYHLLIMRYVVAAERASRYVDDDFASSLFNECIQKMGQFFQATLLPDGHLARIGDTVSGSQSNQAAHIIPYLAEKPSGGVYAFPDAGYFIVRAEETDANGLHLIFNANLRSSKHKHADDLSIILQEGKTPWLIDGGAINKETSDPRRNAARFDPGSHNTWRVNGGGYSFNRRTAEGVRFISTYDHENWNGACAVNELYTGGKIMRFVVHVPRRRLVIVIDHAVAKDKETAEFEQFWHFAPGTTFASGNAGFLATQKEDSLHLQMAFDPSPRDIWDQWEGSEDQPIGWTMTSWNEVVPNPVIRRRFSEADRWCGTVFHLTGTTTQPISCNIEPFDSGAVVLVRIADETLRFTMGTAGTVMETN